ncbi:YcaO-like family protein [Nocardiopsis xinjiangensis]|uniref:YcaO-like family protein n=1 Tax=Nocardiopsis xinjiangensis TaxID=124285 RepID=UPI00034990F6|nr:YcaO-like family protein [Nocardiopsis xinjiangensis]
MSTAFDEPAPAGSVPWTTPEQAERVMSGFVSPVTGLVRRLFERTRDTSDLYAFSVGSEAADSRMLLGTRCNKVNGGGGSSLRDARLAAIGEAVERYSGAWVPFDRLEYGTWSELTDRGLDCLPPKQYKPFADWQYEQTGASRVPFTESTWLPWVQSRRLADGALVWIPAQPVYLRADMMDVNPIADATSNGLAYSSTPDEALVGALLELVERDAVMITWYKQLSMPLVDVDSDPALSAYMSKHVAPTGLDVSLVDLSAFSGVSTVLAVVRNEFAGAVPLGLGAAAASSPVTAATKAVAEAVSTRTWGVAKRRAGESVAPGSDYDETVQDFDDHIALHSNNALTGKTRFLDSSPARSRTADMPILPSESPGELRDALISSLHEDGVDLYAVDLTSPDVREAGGHVVKVFSPQLQPLDAGYRRRCLGGERLHSRPVELGLLEPGTEPFVNPTPHPFP